MAKNTNSDKAKAQGGPGSAAAVKDPEEIAVDFIQKIKVYLVPAIVIFVAVLIVALVMHKKEQSTKKSEAASFNLLDEAGAVTNPFSMKLPNKDAKEKIAKLDALLEKHADSAAAPQALFKKGRLLAGQEKYQEASDAFKSVYSKYADKRLLATLARLSHGHILLKEKKFKEANELFLQASKTTYNTLKYDALLQAAISSCALGDVKNAELHINNLLLGGDLNPLIKSEAQLLLKQIKMFTPEQLKKIYAQEFPARPKPEEKKAAPEKAEDAPAEKAPEPVKDKE